MGFGLGLPGDRRRFRQGWRGANRPVLRVSVGDRGLLWATPVASPVRATQRGYAGGPDRAARSDGYARRQPERTAAIFSARHTERRGHGRRGTPGRRPSDRR
jgi:hypothetical protein